MRLILTGLLLAVVAGLVNCEGRPGKYLPVNDRPLNKAEQKWAVGVLTHNDSVKTDTAIRIYYTQADNSQLRRPYIRGFSYTATWGKMSTVNNYDARGWVWGGVAIDGVLDVHEPGRWWRVVRETLNRLAKDNYYKVWQADSIRLFKLDSTMKAIGR